MKSVVERFIEYVKIDTQSGDISEVCPSTPGQLEFAKLLAKECQAIGLEDVKVDKFGFMTATLPANKQENVPVIGLLAHMDTSPDAPGKGIDPRIVKNYDGGDIKLNEKISLRPSEFASLKKYIGQDLIVTDGNTLLGADDKAGIAEILSAMEYLLAHPEIPHGKIRIAFTPDEEIGSGINNFDVKGFGADYAYTVDGGEVGELVTETFNASTATFNITGKSVHPGYSKGTMLNASLVAAEIMAAFPVNSETPATTEAYEGFYHLTNISGEVGEAQVSYILRDHDAAKLAKREEFAKKVAEDMNRKYGEGTVEFALRQQYRNMHEVLKDQLHIIDRAKEAIKEAGLTLVTQPIRGGTDGARLSFMGLPCPNLFYGGHNAHGPYEYLPVQSMEAAVQVIVNICKHHSNPR